MALADDLKIDVAKIFREQWTTRAGQVVPDPAALRLGNDAVEFDRATILYADLAGSTALVDSKKWQFAAEVYKTYLHCAAKLIRAEAGVITSYDGDRVMGVFIGDAQCTSAARCALKINYAVAKIINPAMVSQYSTSYAVQQTVGIDVSQIRAARTGVRGGNDIVWVGRAANYAAKLTDRDGFRTWITKDVYDNLHRVGKISNNTGANMWTQNWWPEKNLVIYGSNWTWEI